MRNFIDWLRTACICGGVYDWCFFNGLISNVQNSLLTGDQYRTAGTLGIQTLHKNPFWKRSDSKAKELGCEFCSYSAILEWLQHRRLPGYFTSCHCYILLSAIMVWCGSDMPGSEWNMPKTKSSDQISVTLIRWHVHKCEDLSAPSHLHFTRLVDHIFCKY